MTVLLSVITATYNSEQTILDTLESINKQSYKHIEHIIVDGGSTDNTLSLIEQHSCRCVKLISEKDEGIYDALNKGIINASGDVVGFLHSDDVLATDDIMSFIAGTFLNKNVDAVYGDLEYVSKANIDNVIRKWESGHFVKRRMVNGWMPPHPTFYMRKKYYDDLGGFNLGYSIAADYDSILRYLWCNDLNVLYIPEVLVKMRVGGASNRSISNIIKKTKEDIIAMKSNDLPWLRAIIGKNLSKIPQFFK